MSITKDSIITLPNPHLRQRSKKVGLITPAIRQLANEMIAATLDWEDSRQHELGVALAAVQVDQLLRLIVVRSDFDNKDDKTFQVFINPEITKYEGSQVEDLEGCLSVPDIYGRVLRYERIRLKATSLDGKALRLSLDGFLARIVQHEIDHTNGTVFIDHIKNSKTAFFKLNKDGELKSLDYETDIRKNSILW
jgi:peptide deformylase